MRLRGPLTFRHLIVAVLVMILVNAQLTWWIVFVLKQNRENLDFERQLLIQQAEQQTVRIRITLLEANQLFITAQDDSVGGWQDPPYPFETLSAEGLETCTVGWFVAEDNLGLRVQHEGKCLTVSADSGWLGDLLEVGDSLEIVSSMVSENGREDSSSIPQVRLPPPFDDHVIRPTTMIWNEILEEYRGRIVMMVSEGSFFAILLLVLIGLLWKTMRREVELERRHRNFLSAITHELKSPLAAMRLSLETVLRGRADSNASTRFLENALQDTERLQSLVQKVLEVTRFSGGDSNIRPRISNLSEVVEHAIEAFRSRASASAVRLEADLQPRIGANVDGEAFAIVVSNLLENALKYGGALPRIGVRLERSNGKAVLDVSDNGAGISPEDAPFVFERFYRCGDEMTRTTQGTGLGLFLVKEIVEAHGGRVGIAETGPTGTTFRVTLDEIERRKESR